MTGGASPDWVENRPLEKIAPPLRLGELWASRELIYFLSRRDLKVRYKQAMLGASWVVLQPLVGALSFTFLFNGLAEIETDGSYFVFALTGFVVWSFVSTAMDSGAGSLLAHENMITHVSFPLIAAPMSVMLVGLVDLAVGSTIAVGWSIFAGDGLSPIGMLVGLPASLLLMVLTITGPALLFSPAIVKYRDTRAVLSIGIQVLFFLGPVAYPVELVDERWRTLQFVNPVTGCLALFRWALTSAPAPHVGHVATSAAVAATIALLGLFYFRRNEPTLVDVI